MNYSRNLKTILTKNAKAYSLKNNLSGLEYGSAYIFNDLSMNFFSESFDNIIKIPNYQKRLKKVHSYFPGQDIFEMQSSNSSDALLMNIFANPNTLQFKSLRKLLSISISDNVIFGWNPEFKNETNHKTEIDMLIGNNIFEAKLTEVGFQSKDISIVEKYPYVYEIFDLSLLISNNIVSNYQLIRNIIVAYKYNYNFRLLIDASRIDLIREFYNVKLAIKDKELYRKVSFVTWQEIVCCLGIDLKEFVNLKYFNCTSL